MCLLNIICLSAKGNQEEYHWEPTGPTAEDIMSSQTPAIELAIEKGNLSLVQKLINEGEDINAICRFGCPLLVRAVMSRHFPIVQLLIERGADIDKKNLLWRNSFNGSCSHERSKNGSIFSRTRCKYSCG